MSGLYDSIQVQRHHLWQDLWPKSWSALLQRVTIHRTKWNDGKKILFVDPPWRPIRNVLLWQQQLSRWLVNSLRASTPACCYCCLRQTGFINLFMENGDAVEQERIFSWRNSLITAWSSLPRPVKRHASHVWNQYWSILIHFGSWVTPGPLSRALKSFAHSKIPPLSSHFIFSYSGIMKWD